MNTKNIKDFPEILQISDNTRLLGIGNNNVGDGAKITIDRLMSQSISPSEDNLLSLDDNNKLFVPKAGGIQFNNPFAFGDFKYSDHIISNLSWLRSNGQRNSGTFYEQYYNWLLALYNGEEIITGISVKSVSDSSATDYDYKIDTNSREFILPTETILHPIDGSNNIPVVGNGMSLGLTDGGNNFAGLSIAGEDRLSASLNAYGYNIPSVRSGSPYIGQHMSIGVTQDETKSGIEAKLPNSKANAYLYYFVGDVIQSASLIDVTKIEGQITEIMEQLAKFDEWVYWQDGTEGYRYNKRNGSCEQWGHVGNGANAEITITLFKAMRDKHYQAYKTNNWYFTGGTAYQYINIYSKTNNSFKTFNGNQQVDGTGFDWFIRGYLAEGEF